jgi:hypothetical protein
MADPLLLAQLDAALQSRLTHYRLLHGPRGDVVVRALQAGHRAPAKGALLVVNSIAAAVLLDRPNGALPQEAVG